MRIRVEVMRFVERRDHDVEATVYGVWAAHRAVAANLSCADFWTVTHVPTGRSIGSVCGRLDEAQANAIASQLNWQVTPEEVSGPATITRATKKAIELVVQGVISAPGVGASLPVAP